jgi:hypothetical protein
MNVTTLAQPNNGTPQTLKASLLSRVQKGMQEKPLRVVIYGPEGIGKSTFAAGAPAPIWIGADKGTQHLDISRMPVPTTWEDVRASVRELLVEPHDFRTVVIDPLNWLEPMVWRYVCDRDDKGLAGAGDIEAYGFAKGFKAALIEWRVLARDLEELSDKRAMNVVLVAHSQTRKQKSPDVEDFDRYTLAMHEEAAALFRQWADYVFLVKRGVYAKAVDKEGKRFKGASDGSRVLQTAWAPAFDAKSRPQLPDPLPFPEGSAWSTFIRAREWVANQLTAKRAELEQLLVGADPVNAAAVRAYVAEDPNDSRRYDEVINALKTAAPANTNTETTKS